ncbi:MAG: MMPL family transporter [Verrucomicrobiales bacterium]|nr:MMPL family transporter [Verrucomicrobiales bacterium]
MPEPHDRLFVRFLLRVAHLVLHYPRWVFWPQVALAILCVFYTVQRLQFSTSRNDLVSDKLHYHHIFLEFRKEFAAEDDIVVLVESESPEKNRQFIERLGAKVEAEPKLFTDIFYRGDLAMLGPKALLFLDDTTLGELRTRLREFRPFLDRVAGTTNLASLFQLINRQFRGAQRATNAENDALIGTLPALERIVSQARESLFRPGTPPSPGVNALFGSGPEAERQIYLTYDGGRLFLLSTRPKHRDVSGDAISRLRHLVAETRLEVPGVNGGVPGGGVLELDEMEQSQPDSIKATVLSLGLVGLIFVLGYNEAARPMKAMFCLLIGLCYSMGYTTLTVGRLNILTITFAPMLVGMAIDFGVHLITRFEEELRNGVHAKLAMRKAMVNTGEGIYSGAFTTAGAFFAMSFTDFAGVREMGIITGGGLLVCLVPMMTMLPTMLLRGARNVRERGAAPVGVPARERLENLILGYPRAVTVGGIVVSALCIAQFSKVPFDYDLRNMQSKGLPAVVYEKKLMDSTPRSVLFGAVVASNAQEAVRLQARLTNLTTVADVDSIAPILARDSAPQLATITAIRNELASLRFPEPTGALPDLVDLGQTLTYLQSYLGQAADAVQAESSDTNLLAQLRTLRASIGMFRIQLGHGDREQNRRKLAEFERAFFEDLRTTFETLRNQDASSGLAAADLPEPIRNRFIGRTGKFLLQVYPKIDVWIRTNQLAFVGELRTIVPDVTGDPVQLLEYTTLLKQSYETAAYYALAAMAVLVYLQFRSLRAVLLAHVPVILAGVWLVGFMGLFGVPFNPANIMTLPLVVGIGVTYGVHILTRFAEEKNPAILARSTGKAVLVSGLTTVAGFGSLVLAKHQGIVSLGFVMSVGISASMIGGLVSLPALLVLLKHEAQPKKEPSDTNAPVSLGREEPRF